MESNVLPPRLSRPPGSRASLEDTLPLRVETSVRSCVSETSRDIRMNIASSGPTQQLIRHAPKRDCCKWRHNPSRISSGNARVLPPPSGSWPGLGGPNKPGGKCMYVCMYPAARFPQEYIHTNPDKQREVATPIELGSKLTRLPLANSPLPTRLTPHFSSPARFTRISDSWASGRGAWEVGGSSRFSPGRRRLCCGCRVQIHAGDLCVGKARAESADRLSRKADHRVVGWWWCATRGTNTN